MVLEDQGSLALKRGHILCKPSVRILRGLSFRCCQLMPNSRGGGGAYLWSVPVSKGTFTLTGGRGWGADSYYIGSQIRIIWVPRGPSYKFLHPGHVWSGGRVLVGLRGGLLHRPEPRGSQIKILWVPGDLSINYIPTFTRGTYCLEREFQSGSEAAFDRNFRVPNSKLWGP